MYEIRIKPDIASTLGLNETYTLPALTIKQGFVITSKNDVEYWLPISHLLYIKVI